MKAGDIVPPKDFDFDRFLEVSDGDAAFERELAGEYLAQAQVLLTEIAVAIERGEPAAMRIAAHTLKGSSRTLGANALGALAARLEQIGSGADAGAAAGLVACARSSLESVRQQLDRHFGSGTHRRTG